MDRLGDVLHRLRAAIGKFNVELATHFDMHLLRNADTAGNTFTIFPSGNSVAKLYDVSKIPTILVVDRDGVVVYRMTGFEDEVLGGLERFVVQQLRDPPGG